MITTAFDHYLDQQRQEQQAAIALELFISGEGDGFNGVRPASSDLAYITGYSQGLRTKMADIKRQAEMLETEGVAYEAKVEAIFGEELVF